MLNKEIPVWKVQKTHMIFFIFQKNGELKIFKQKGLLILKPNLPTIGQKNGPLHRWKQRGAMPLVDWKPTP